MLSDNTRSVDSVLKQLQENEVSFYDVFFGVRSVGTTNSLAIALEVLRQYFNAEDKGSIVSKRVVAKAKLDDPSTHRPIIEFDSKNHKNDYLSWVLSFFNNAIEDGLVDALLIYLNNNRLALSEKSLQELLGKVLQMSSEYDKSRANTALQQQALTGDNFVGDALKSFVPELPQEFSVAAGNERDLHKSYLKESKFFDYKPDYQLHVEEVKYVALARMAADMKLPATHDDVTSSCRIEDIDLRCGKSSKQARNYFSFEHNMRKALEALNVAKYGAKPAFLTCSSGGHWATLGLTLVNNELHIFKFDSLNGDMADQLAIELKQLAVKAGGFVAVHDMHNLSVAAQYSQNCGIASAGFIAEFTKFVRDKKSIEEIKKGFGEAYRRNIIDPSNKAATTEAFISGVFDHIHNGPKDLGQPEHNSGHSDEASESDLTNPTSTSLSSSQNIDFFYDIHYDANRLYGFLDLSMQRYKLYYDLEGILSPRAPAGTAELTCLYVCTTILCLPGIILEAFINLVRELTFIALCSFYEGPLNAKATEYAIELTRYEALRKGIATETPTPNVCIDKEVIKRFYSKDLVDLVIPPSISIN